MESGPHSPAGSVENSDNPPTWPTRVRRWILSYGLYLETALSVLLVVGAVVTLIVVFFGAITSLPTGSPPTDSTSGILDFGFLLVNSVVVLMLGLGAFLIIHAGVELWTRVQTGQGLKLDDGGEIAYIGVRTIQTIAAIAFVGPILVGVTLAQLNVISNSPPNMLLLFLLATGVLMLLSVFAQAVGRVGRVLTSN
jgi:hypothetical protein